MRRPQAPAPAADGENVDVLLASAVALAGLALFAHQRHTARPRFACDVLSQDREVAIRTAALRVSGLTAVDVSHWLAFATGWSDVATVRTAHQLERLEQSQSWLSRWGLVTSWRVRFVGEGESVLVGLAPGGEVNHLALEGRTARTLVDYAEPSRSTWYLPKLDGDSAAGVWSEVEPVAGAGGSEVEAVPDGRWSQALGLPWHTAGPTPAMYQTAGGQLRLQVRASDKAAVDVRAEVCLSGSDSGRYQRAERRVATARRIVLIAMVVAIPLAGLAPVLEGAVPDPGRGLILAALTWAALVSIEPNLYPQAVVEDFDLRSSLVQFRRRHRRQCLLAALVTAGLVFLCATLGFSLLALVDHVQPRSIGIQVLVGAATALGWLGLSATLASWLRRRGRLAVLPELPPEALRRLGQSWPHVVSVSTQSAVGEEALFRLIALPLVWHLTGQPLVAVAMSAGLWACLHDTSDVRPRLYRLAELWLLGVVLGTLLIEVGFVAALAAHFTHNLVVLGAPLARRSEATRSRTVARTGP